MTQPAGWYDDPQDASQLRYWDGVVWSEHVSPKISPTVGQSTIGLPYGVIPASARPQSSGSQGAQGAPNVQDGYGSPQRGQGEPGGRSPYGQSPGQQDLGWQSHPATTPDGVVLSGWWKRVLARILDGIIIGIVALPLTFAPMKQAANIFGDYIQQVMTATQAGSTTMPVQPTAQLTGPIMQASLITLALYLVYEITFLTRTGATIGRMVVGISVRLRDKAGPPPLVADDDRQDGRRHQRPVAGQGRPAAAGRRPEEDVGQGGRQPLRVSTGSWHLGVVVRDARQLGAFVGRREAVHARQGGSHQCRRRTPAQARHLDTQASERKSFSMVLMSTDS